jgi:hypothetical protein
VLTEVLGRAVQLVGQGGARRARTLRQGQQRGLPAWRAGADVVCGYECTKH